MPPLIDTAKAVDSINELVVDLASLELVDFSPFSLLKELNYLGRRNTRNMLIADALKDIEETFPLITHLETRLAELRRILQQRATSVRNLFAISLPTELLVEIFSIVADTDPSPRAGLRVSHVSSQWRAVALALPKLWTTLKFKSSYVHDSDMLDEFVRRSGRLEISLSSGHGELPTTRKALPRGFARNRIRSISLCGDISLTAFRALTRYGCSSLREVSLSVPARAAPISETPSFEWCKECNDIEVLHLHGVKLIAPGAQEQDSDPDWFDDWTPRLQELFIRGVDCRSVWATLGEIPWSTIERVSLSEVVWCQDEKRSDVCEGIVTSLSGLDLEHLELDRCEGGFVVTLLGDWGDLPKSVTINLRNDDESDANIVDYIGDMLVSGTLV